MKLSSFIGTTAFSLSLLGGVFLAPGCSSSGGGDDLSDSVDRSDEALVGKVCGGRVGNTCGAREYCRYSAAAICGRADATGTCTRKPTQCPTSHVKVCGCDGKTYENACKAHSRGVSVLSVGPCAPACDPTKFEKVVAPSIQEVTGFWSRRSVSGITETIEELSLRSDFTYDLHKVVGPYCTAGIPCARFATRFYDSRGTFALDSGHGVQLSPETTSPPELAENFQLQSNCSSPSRLATTESDVEVFLEKQANRCVEDGECSSKDLGPNPIRCAAGTNPAKTCATETRTCEWACKAAPKCPAGQKECAACGAPPPDGICKAYVCVDGKTDCPLFM